MKRMTVRTGLFRVVVYLFEHPNSTYYSIRKGTGIPANTVKNRLKELTDSGYAVRMDAKTRQHNSKPYTLSPKGRNLARQIKVLRALGVDA